MTPTLRVILSDLLFLGGLVAVALGFGPFFMMFGFAAYYFLCFHLKPRIVDISRRNRHVIVRWTWNLLVISIALVYFFFQQIYVARVYSYIVCALVILWTFIDDICFAREMEKPHDAA
jgi:hypothetical protein